MRRIHGEGKPKPEQVHAKAQRPRMPSHLTGVAAAKWKELVRELYRRGTVTRADATQIEIIATQYARLVMCQKEIESEGVMIDTSVLDSNGTEITKRVLNPACKLAVMLENSLRAGLQQIGCSPASREKSRPAKVPASEAPLPPDSAGALAGAVFDQIENDDDPEGEK